MQFLRKNMLFDFGVWFLESFCQSLFPALLFFVFFLNLTTILKHAICYKLFPKTTCLPFTYRPTGTRESKSRKRTDRQTFERWVYVSWWFSFIHFLQSQNVHYLVFDSLRGIKEAQDDHIIVFLLAITTLLHMSTCKNSLNCWFAAPEVSVKSSHESRGAQ